MKIFIVIPLFNEEKHVNNVIKEVLNYKLPVVAVDDGSKDNSFNVASKFKITNLRHEINLGKGAAMKTGADYAFSKGADAVVFMDSDGQHAPTDLQKFINKLLDRDCDVIFGSRNLNYGVPLVRYLGNKFASVLVSLLFGIYVSDLICGYRAVTKKGYQKIKWESTGYGVETEMVVRTARTKSKYCEIPIETIYLDKVKGVTILDAFGILLQVIKWRLTI